MRPKGNGLIPLHDEKQEERGFFCIKLVQFLKWGQMNASGFGMKGSQPQKTVVAFTKTAAQYMKERSRTDLYN